MQDVTNSTRVLCAPGGNSSLNLFGGDAPAAPAMVKKAPAPADESQTFGRRVIQHTEHMGIGDKRSTRVHAAPGGNSSLNLFGGEPEPVRAAPAPMVAAPPQPKPQQPVMQAAGGHMRIQTEHTGISDRCSSRVLAAPGGNSSLNLFGGDDAPPAAAQAAVPRQAPPPALPAQPQQQAAGGHMRVQTEHMGISDRSSSRVLAAPGGNSTIFLGDAAANGTAEDRMAALRRMRSA